MLRASSSSEVIYAMTPQAARVVRICGWIRFAAFAGAIIVMAFWGLHARWLFIIILLLAASCLEGGGALIGTVAVVFPGFQDQVKGLMLGKMSEEQAIAQASRGEIIGAIIKTPINIAAYAIPLAMSFGAFGVR
jgi:hypothetical protein